jgi:hypothetical protein
LFNAGWRSKHQQYFAIQLQQQVDMVLSKNRKKLEDIVSIVITAGLDVRKAPH